MSNKQYNNSNWNTVNKRPPHPKRNYEDNSHRLVITDDFKKELTKNDINVNKWYHKLLTGQYYKSNGAYFYEEPILKRLANEYQKAIHMKNIDTLVLIKNELLNHIPEPVWIFKYLNGDVCDNQGKSLSKINTDLENLSKEYLQIYSQAKETAIG